MKKFLICLLTIFAITPAFSENYIIFKAEAVEKAINEMVSADKRKAAAAEYEKHMDKTTGKISVSGVYKVCYAAGFDIKNRGGYNDCQSFVETIIAASGFGSGSAIQKSCSEELDGIWTLSADGKQYQCLGRDGSFLVYRNACTDKKDGDTNSQCWQNAFSNIYIQYAVAKSAIQQWAKEKLAGVTLTCKNMKTTNKTSDGWLYCVGNNRPYTFKFAGFGPNNSVDAERANTMALMCKLADHNMQYAWARSANMGVGGTCLCAKCDASGNGVYPLTDLKDGISKCNQVATWGKRLGGYSAKPVNDGSAVLKSGRAASAIRHDMCFLYGGRASTSNLVNELASSGIDNLIFLDITVRNSEDVIEKVREYARNVMGADKITSVECETTHRTETGSGGLFGMFDVKKADIIRCRINGKKVDFAFKDLSTMSNFRTKAGLQGFECKVQQGDYTGKECKVLSQDKCEKIKKGNAQVCPECKSVYWNAELGSCVLPNSADAHNLDKGIKYATIVGTAAAGVAITVVSGGTAGAGAYLLVVEVAGAAIETYQTAKIDAAAQKFLDAASKCNDANCAEKLISEEFSRLSNMQNDFTSTEVFEIDRQFAKLFNLVPETSSVFAIEQRTLEANALPFYNPASWEPEQVWRAVGVGLQMAGLFAGVLNKVFIKEAPRLSNTTKVLRAKFQKALPAAKETKLLAGGDDAAKLLANGDEVKLLTKADDVPLLPGQRMTESQAKKLLEIEERNAARAAGTATDYQKGIHTKGENLLVKDRQDKAKIIKDMQAKGFANEADIMEEARAVMRNKTIVAKEVDLAKAKEHLKWLNENPSRATKGDINSTKATIDRLNQELAGMGRTYANTVDDAARAATKVDDAADAVRAASKADDAADAARAAGDGAEVATRKLSSEFGFDLDNEIRNISSGKSNELRIPKSRANLSESEWALLQEKLRREGLEMTDVPGRFGTDQIIIAKRGTNVADAARAATKADDVARGAAKTAAEIDGAYKAGAKATTRAEILEKWGLKANATEAEIAARHRELAMKFHPDRAGAEFTDVMADINRERDLLRTLPRESGVITDGARLAITAGNNTDDAVRLASKIDNVPMIGHNVIGGFAAGRALARALDGPDGTTPVFGAVGTSGNGGTSGGASGTNGVASSGAGVVGGSVTGNNANDVDEIYGGTSNAAGVTADMPRNTTGGADETSYGTNTSGSNQIGGTTSSGYGTPNVSSEGTSSSSGNNTKKSGISGWGAAAIGAGVAGLGVGAALLIGGAGKKGETSGAGAVTNANGDLFNAVRNRANGVIGTVENSNIELVPIETSNGLKENIVSISNHAVVLVKHNNNMIPFMVDVVDGVTKWVPFTSVDMNSGAFTRYTPKADIMRTAKIAEKLTEMMPPLQMQYFSSPNADGLQFASPSMNGYQLINNNALRYLASVFNKNTRLGVFFMDDIDFIWGKDYNRPRYV